MRGFFIIFTLLLIELGVYYFGTKNLQDKSLVYFKYLYFFGLAVLLTNIGFYIANYLGQNPIHGHPSVTFLIGISSAFIISKLVFLLFSLIGEIVPIAHSFIYPNTGFSPNRREFIGKVALGIAALPFSSLSYGVLKGRFDFKIHRVTLKFKDLPKAFDGFKIAQISDVHSGSFDSDYIVKKGLNLLQKQSPDMILFTGDLVNNYEFEIKPFIENFNSLKAPYGKFSVLGNHDYGLYAKWNSQTELNNNLDALKGHHKSMGFDLLNNQNRTISKNGENIKLIGVENWGNPPFPQYGDLDKALTNIDRDDFSILMSHDPDHWEQKTLKNEKHIHLTLAGHTHGMQFGVEIPGFKWSPVKYKYPRWAGLYKEQNQFLYVNRGFGYIGYPGRFGIWPEITIIELKKDLS